ncbi:MAG: CPBP family intramembrane glutamic endopeptidase [Isosphaeraceae bacterium]
MQRQTGLSPETGLVYSIMLFGAWTLYLAVGYGRVRSIVGGDLLHEVIRVAIFVGPAALVVRQRLPEAVGRMGLRAGLGRGIAVGLAIGLAYGAVALVVGTMIEGRSLPDDIPWAGLPRAGFSVATLVEEFAFRGVLLQSFLQWGSARSALVTSALFAAVHIPGWVLLGAMSVQAMAAAFGSIFLLGMILAIVMLRSRSLWTCVIVHAANNLVSALMAGGAGAS